MAWAPQLDGVDALVSICLLSASGWVASRAESTPHYAASTIKLAVLGALLTSDPHDLVVHSDFASAAGGRFELSQADDQDDATWGELGRLVDSWTLAARMIQVSSNLATNLLVEALGLDAVTTYIASMGLEGSLRMGRLIGDTAAEEAGITNTVTATGLAELLEVLVKDARALNLLEGQQHRNLIPAGLPQGTPTASKSGWVPGMRHDVALVRPEGAPEYVLAVCTSGLEDERAEALIRELSRVTYAEWLKTANTDFSPQ